VDSLELIDCISRTIDPYTNHEAYEALAKQPDLRFVVSNTTEAGIVFDPDCRFTDIPAASYPGKLTQLLYRRYSEFKGDEEKGLIILPCELIFNNGQRLSECIHQYIDHWQDEMDDAKGFRSWFDKACHVCTTLVDRIVPGFPKQQIESIWQRLGYADNQVVQGEVYHLWVIETPEGLDSDQLVREFPVSKAGVNVILTNDETPYHERKVTLLNGPHTVLSPVAFLSGIDIVRDACKDPIVGEYVRQVIFDELMPTLSLPEDELRQFANDVLERFMNPFVDHRVTSIMLNSFPKYQTRDLPALKTYLERKGELPRGLVKGLAAITTYYRGGNRADGTPIEPNDDPRILALLTELWKTGDTRKVAIGVLAAKDLIWKKYGNLNLIPGLTDMVTEYLDEFCNRGEK
jgi:tagaturonate reductase